MGSSNSRTTRQLTGLHRIGASICGLLALCSTALANETCDPSVIDLKGEWGQARFTIDVADDAQERSQGLMNVPSMPRSKGMLFVYEQVSAVTFWMENTLIPLDMLFIREDGVVTHIHENAIPLDRTSIPGGPPVLAVLEINGGLASTYGITTGTQVRHPAFDPAGAAWPCDAAQ